MRNGNHVSGFSLTAGSLLMGGSGGWRLTSVRAGTVLITVGLVWSFIEDSHLSQAHPAGLKKSYREIESAQRLQMHRSGVGLVCLV